MSDPAPPTIRSASAPDLADVRALLEETWHATYDTLLGRDKVTDIASRWHAEEVLAAEVGRAGRQFLVAEIDGRIVATASAAMAAEGQLDLNRLYVLPTYQKRGVGAALLAATLGAFPAAARVRLEVEPNNAPAIAFYERAGFSRVATGNACGADVSAGVAHLIMEKRL